MANPFKRTFELVQHTPLIHFQHDQAGATLRATEVKAKLDRFLWKKLGSIPDKWLTGVPGNDRKALNYKLSFLVSKPTVKDAKVAKGYFGNMGDVPPKFLVSSGKVTMVVHSWLTDLLDTLESNIGAFLRSHNFGSRQNRGFGSFTLLRENDIRPEKAYSAFKVNQSDSISLRGESLSIVTMEVIDWFYRSLRQGINHGTFDSGSSTYIPYLYMKPMLFQYAASKGIQWEKKTIKQWFFNTKLEQQKNHYPITDDESKTALHFGSNNQKIVRDLFGLSTEQTWMNYPGKNNKPSITKEDAALTPHMTEEEKRKLIERYPSPLHFKPVQHSGDDSMTVYFWAETIDDEYLNASFKIKKDGQNNTHPALKVWSDFDFPTFFEFAFAEGRIDNSIECSDKQGEDLESLLLDIYQNIRENTLNHVQ